MKSLFIRKSAGLIAIVSLIFLCTGTGVAADSSWSSVQKNERLVVGFCAQYPPFESKTADGNFEGFDVDLGKALGKQLGVRVVFKDGEWQGLIAGMNKGDYDMLLTCMSKSTARKKNASFSDTYYDLTEVIVVRRNDTDIKEMRDLKEKRCGVQMSTSSEQAVESFPGLFKEVRKYNYTTEAFLDLKYKRIDAVVCGYAYAVIQIKKDPAFKITGKPLHSSEIVMVMPKGAALLTKEINTALKKVKENGTYDHIHSTWLKVD